MAEKDKKEVAADLKPIYKAVNAERGFEMLLEFEAKWAGPPERAEVPAGR